MSEEKTKEEILIKVRALIKEQNAARETERKEFKEKVRDFIIMIIQLIGLLSLLICIIECIFELPIYEIIIDGISGFMLLALGIGAELEVSQNEIKEKIQSLQEGGSIAED